MHFRASVFSITAAWLPNMIREEGLLTPMTPWICPWGQLHNLLKFLYSFIVLLIFVELITLKYLNTE